MKDYGFRFVEAPSDSPVVASYVLKHLVDNGYPLDTKPAAEHWVAIVKADDKGVERVYGVWGWKAWPDFIEITDFYLFPDRIGILAGYDAIRHIKQLADEAGAIIRTATPAKNAAMIEAYKKTFDVEAPAIVVYEYVPPSRKEAQSSSQEGESWAQRQSRLSERESVLAPAS